MTPLPALRRLRIQVFLIAVIAVAAPVVSAADLPPSPSSAEVTSWTAGDYNDHVVSTELALLRELAARVRGWSREAPGAVDEAEAAARRKEVHDILERGLVAARELPPWHGDASFRDAIIDAYTVILGVTDRGVAQRQAVFARPTVRDQDLVDLEAIEVSVTGALDASERAVRDAQAAFARRHGFRLVQVDKVEMPDVPRFGAPGLPPEGSRLDARTYVMLAMRYHNQFVGHQVQIVEAMNGFVLATSGPLDSLEDQRLRALAAVRAELAASRAEEPWQGDDSLRAAVIVMGEQIEDILETEGEEYTPLTTIKRFSKRDAEQFNGIGDRMESRFRAALEPFPRAQATFRRRWHLAEYEAWLQRPPV